MAWKNEHFKKVMEIVSRLPNGIYWDNEPSKMEISFQANTLEKVREIRACFPSFWRKDWIDSLGWWEFTGMYGEWKIKIYACYESPKMCTPVKVKRKVVERIPTVWEEKIVEKEVIVGWDCKNKEVIVGWDCKNVDPVKVEVGEIED